MSHLSLSQFKKVLNWKDDISLKMFWSKTGSSRLICDPPIGLATPHFIIPGVADVAVPNSKESRDREF